MSSRGALSTHFRAATAAAVLTLFAVGPWRAAATAEQAEGAKRSPVLVELFTSEGCSSCPPADDVLARLVREQPIPGVEIVALGFHVDYWNQLGWRDRFSSAAHTARQNRYTTVWQQARIYTPQLVVDGAQELIGSDWNAASRAIAAAASSSKAGVTLAPDPEASASEGRVALRIDVQPSGAITTKAEVWLAVTEDGLVSDVARGENENKRLAHVAVVRTFDRVGVAKPHEPFAATRTLSFGRDWNRERLKAVVIVQDTKSRRVLGAAMRPL